MSIDANSDLHSFHQFVAEQLANGHSPMSPEEALDIWRMQHPSSEQFAEEVQAIRDALADVEAGDTGIPVDEYLVLCQFSLEGWYSRGVHSWKSDFAKEGISCRSVIV